MKSKVLFYIFLFLGLTKSLNVFAQTPVSNFSISSPACVDGTLQVTDMSSDFPTAWSYSVDGMFYTGMQNPVLTFTAAGFYTISLEATNGNGTGTTTTQVIFVFPLPVVSVSGGTAVCIGASTTLTASGADTYTWDTGSNLSNIIVSPVTNTMYTVFGTNTISGCSSSIAANVMVNSLPTISVNSGTICNGTPFVIMPGGATSYTFSGGSATVTPSSNTSYTIMGEDANSCTASAVSDVTVFALPSISVNSGTICMGDQFVIVPSGGINYTFSAGSDTVTPSVNASYTVTGDDANGCTNSAVSDVTVHALPVVSVNSGTVCAGTPFVMSPSGAFTYTFSSGSATVTPVTTTSYSVTGTSTDGCLSSNVAVSDVTVFALPVISVNSGSICTGSSFVLTPSGASTFTFSGGSATVSPLSNTSYSVTGTSTDGCVSAGPAVSDVTVNAVPTVGVNSGSICAGNSFVLVPTGASTYTITGGTATVSPVTNTSYSVTGTSAAGCVSSNTAVSNVTVNAVPVVSVTSGTLCVGSSFVMVPSGASTYTFSSGSATVSPAANASYSVTGTSAAGCVSSNTAISNVIVYALPTISVNSGSICSGSSFVMVPSGASTYTFSGGSATVSPLSNTSYSVTGTSTDGCISSGPAVSDVTVNAVPSVGVNSGSICAGGSFVLVPTGAASYTITGGTATVSPVTNTSYSVTGTSAAGCVSSNTAVSNVTVNAVPVVSVTSGTLCVGSSFVMVPSGASTYTFSSGSATVSPAANASYSVTGTSAAGCVSSNTAISNVIVYALPTISVNSGSICSGSSFVMVPSGASTYTFSGGSATVSPVSNTSYSVTGTSTDGCISSGPAVSDVTVNAVPSVGVNSGSICAGGSFVLIPTGAASYTITGGTATVSPLSNTSYSVTGTSAAGCVSSNTAVSNVTVNAVPVVSVTSGTICSGSSFVMVPSGAATYTFSGGSATVSPVSNTSYSVTGTSAEGCISSNTAVSNITVFTAPIIGANSGSICSGSSFTIIPTGGSTYTITGGTATVSPATTTSYSVTGTSTDGCVGSNTAIANVTVFTTPTVAVTSGTLCSGLVFTMVPSGASTYTFSNGSATVNPLTNASYSVTGTSTAGCVSSNTAVSNVTVLATPTIGVNSGSICSGKSFTIIPTGGSTYTITGGTATVSPVTTTAYSVTGTSTDGCVGTNTAVSNVTVFITPTVAVTSGTLCSGLVFTMIPSGASTYTFSNGSNTVNPVANASYSVTGTSTAGCVSSNTAVSTVTVFATPTIGVNSGSICSGKSFTIIPTGGSTYTITGGTATVSPVTTTAYSVTGTSTAGCVGTNTAVSNVTVFATPTVAVNSGTICSGGVFTIAPTGAASFVISGGSSTVNPLVNSQYTVTGTSTAGCASGNTVVSSVTVFALPSLTITGTSTVCNGVATTLTVSGATSYLWNNAAVTTTISVTPSVNTTYSVVGTSSNGCVSNTSQIVTVNQLPTITVNSGAICPGNNFTVVPGGASTYTITGGNFTVAPATSTTYIVSGTNSLGCVSATSAVASVSVVNTLTVTISGTTTICNGQTATLTANGAATYSWNTGIQTQTITLNPNTSTNYTVMGISGSCSNIAVVSLSVNPLPTLSVNSGTICQGGTFTIVPTGGITYTFTGGSNTVSPNVTTSYTVTGTDINGCTSTLAAVANVTVSAAPALTVNSGSICAGQVFTITPAGANTYTYSGGSATVSPAITTSYTVTGTDLNGCVTLTSAVVDVTVNPNPTVTATSSLSTICEGETAVLTASGASTYSWSNGSSSASISSTLATTTTFTVTGFSGGCSSSATVSQNVNPCAGINNVVSNHIEVSLYPNPNNGVFTIEVPNNCRVTATNVLGEVVLVQDLFEGKNILILEKQNNGVYFMNVSSGNRTSTIKVIKN